MADEIRSSGSHPVEKGRRRSLGLWIWSVLVIADAMMLTQRLGGSALVPFNETTTLLSLPIIACLSWFGWVLQSPTRSQLNEFEIHRFVPLGISLAITFGWFLSVSGSGSLPAHGEAIGILLIQLFCAIVMEFGDSFLGTRRSVVNVTRQAKMSPAPSETKSVSTSAESQPESIELRNEPLATDVDAPCSPLPTITHSIHDDIESETFDEAEFDEELDEPEGEQDSNETLWLSRRSIGNQDFVEGWMRVDFASGQRETTMHIAFCPPLRALPQIETEDIEGAGLEIRVATAFPFGTRLSVRRSGSIADELVCRVGFIASAIAIPRAA